MVTTTWKNWACFAKDARTVQLASLTSGCRSPTVPAASHRQCYNSRGTNLGDLVSPGHILAGTYCWHSEGRAGAQGLAMCTHVPP